MKIIGGERLNIRLDKFSKDLPKLADKVLEEMAKEGKKQAEMNYSRAFKDGEDDGSFGVEKTAKGWSFNAYGKEPVFVEFGAGVHFNRSSSYPIQKPNGIADIGKYGYHLGSLESWRYKDSKGNEVRTFGTPAQMPMYNASKYVKTRVVDIARKVFK